MPSPFTFKELLFPLAGLNRKNAYQSQPPYTTLDALNVRPYRPESKRMAGGSRPGTAPWMPNSIGGRVCMLAVGRGVAVKYREGSGHTVADTGSGNFIEGHTVGILQIKSQQIG